MLLISFLGYSQPMENALALNMIPPVKAPIKLSGTFGELRTNHFHWGLDIKSKNGTIGEPIYSIQEGYISKVKIDPFGYGNVIYISHPTGLTSVYAHLSGFYPALEEYIIQQQYRQESYPLDLLFNKKQFPVHQGMQIGKMGNSGYSFGPHLHFEIRETESQKPVNPLLFNFIEVHDNQAPHINALAIYHLDHQYRSYDQQIHAANEISNQDTLIISAWRIGLGLEAFDPHNAWANKNGIYQVSIKNNGKFIYQFKMDSIDFNQAADFYGHSDLAANHLFDRKLHKCYRQPGNRLTIYQYQINNGVIALYKDVPQKIEVEVMDFHHNKSRKTFWVKRASDIKPVEYPPFKFLFEWDQPNQVDVNNFSLKMPKEALFEDLHCRFHMEEKPEHALSKVYVLHDDFVPIKKIAQISIRLSNIADSIKTRAVLCHQSHTGKISIIGKEWDGESISGNTRTMGKFLVIEDTVPPSIVLVSSYPTSTGRKITFKIGDDLASLNMLKYKVLLDGAWFPGIFDPKNRTISCNIPQKKGILDEHVLNIRVTDYVGNENKYDYRFNFK